MKSLVKPLFISMMVLSLAACQPGSMPGFTTVTHSLTQSVSPSTGITKPVESATITLSPTRTPLPPSPTPTTEPTATPTETVIPSPTPTATAATLEEIVQHLDTPEKLSAFLLEEITYADHGGCLSYWPDVFYQKREGNCKDYSTFASYVLAQHGYEARRVVYIFYRNGVQYGHEVATYEIGQDLWIMSNGHIQGPFASLQDYFKSLTSVDYATLLCIKPPGGVTCCNP